MCPESAEISFPAVNTRLAEDFEMLKGRIAVISLFTGKGYKAVRGKETSSGFAIWCCDCDTRCAFRFHTKEYFDEGVPYQFVVKYRPHNCNYCPELEDTQKAESVTEERNQRIIQALVKAATKFYSAGEPYDDSYDNAFEKMQKMIVEAYGMDVYSPVNRGALSSLFKNEKKPSNVQGMSVGSAMQWQQVGDDTRIHTEKSGDLLVGLVVVQKSYENSSSSETAVLARSNHTNEKEGLGASHFKVAIAEAYNLSSARSVTPDMKIPPDNKISSSLGRADSSSGADSLGTTSKKNMFEDPSVPILEREYSDRMSDEIFGVGIIPASHWSVRVRRNASVVKKEVPIEDSRKADAIQINSTQLKPNKKRRRSLVKLKIMCDSSVMGNIHIPQDFIQPTKATQPTKVTVTAKTTAPTNYMKTVRGPIGRMVEQIDPSTGRVVARFRSQRAAERETNIDRKLITKVLIGKATQVGGYGWRVSHSDHDSKAAPKKSRKVSREQLAQQPIKYKAVPENPKKRAKRSTGANLATKKPLDYKVLLNEYQLLVDQGVCETVEFGSSLTAAKRAICEKLYTLKEPESEDPQITGELKEYRKSMRQIQRFEDQEILSIQMERLEWLEGKSAARANLTPKEKRLLKAIECKKRSFYNEPLRFIKSSRVDDCNLCDCNCTGPCNICTAAFSGSVRVDPLAPQVRRVNFFNLSEDEEEDAGEASHRAENSVIALKSLLHSLEFVADDKKSMSRN